MPIILFSFKSALSIAMMSLYLLADAQAVVVWRDDFVDDPAGTLPAIRPVGAVPGDTEDFGISWVDLGGVNMAHVTTTATLSLDGAGQGQGIDGIDSGIRGNFATVEINERFVVSFDINMGSGSGSHLAIGDSLTDNGSIITGDGFFAVRFIKGGNIENWNGTGWDVLGTPASLSGVAVELTMNELNFDLSVGGLVIGTGLNYASARTQLGGMELAFAGNNGSSSQTGLISGSNLGVVPEPSSALFCCLSGLVLLGFRRRGKD